MIKKFLYSFVGLWVVTLSAITVRPVYVETDEAKLFCQVMGKGAPIIVVHGGPGLSQDYLLPQMQELAKEHQVIFYDQRGSGASEGGTDPEHLNLSVFTNDMESVRKAFGFEKISVIGHSWGGFLSMQYAMAYPERVDRLVLLNTIPVDGENFALFIQEYLRRTAPFTEELEALSSSPKFAAGDSDTVAKLFRIIFRTYCASSKHAEELNLHVSSQANQQGQKTYHHFLETLYARPFDFRKELKKFSFRTLIIHGDHDPIPVSTIENLEQAIPNSELVVFDECGHFPYIEKPEQLFPLLKSFLSNSL